MSSKEFKSPQKTQTDESSTSLKSTLKVDDIILSLRIISKIKPGEKFNTNTQNSGIRVQQVSSLQGLWRFFRGENREQNMKGLNHIIEEAFFLIEELLTHKEEEKKSSRALTRKQKMLLKETDQLINELTLLVKQSVEGIMNWKETYQTDTTTCARVDTLLKRIADKLEVIEASIQEIESQ